MFICEVHVSSVAKKLLLKKILQQTKSCYKLYHVPFIAVVKKKIAFKQQMITVRLYHYSKSNQVSQCQGQDLKWAPPLVGGGG